MTAYIIDTETTGLKHNELIEFASIKLTNCSTLGWEEAFCERFKPINQIEYGAMATHHITIDMLQDCVESSCFGLPDDCDYIIGHNIDYDWQVIGCPDVKRICTLALSRKYLPDIDSHKLSALYYYYFPKVAGDVTRNAHSALEDVKMLHQIMHVMIPPYSSFEEMWIDSEGARVPNIMPFGKHKGIAIKELPKDYVAWLLKQNDLDLYIKKALEK